MAIRNVHEFAATSAQGFSVALTAPGTGRVLICLLSARGSSAVSLSSITIGATNGTVIEPSISFNGGWAANTAIAVFTEAQYSAGTVTITPAWSGSINHNGMVALELDDMPQVAPFISALSNLTTGEDVPAGTDLVISSSLAGVPAGKTIIGFSVASDAGTLTDMTATPSANLALLASVDSTVNASMTLHRMDVFSGTAANDPENLTITTNDPTSTVDSVIGGYFVIDAAATPTLSIDSISDTTPADGATVTVNLSNGTAPYTATLDGVAVAMTEVVADAQYSFVVPNPVVWDDKTRTFNTAYNLVVTDSGANSDTVALQITPTHQYTQVSGEPWLDDSVFFGSTVVDGDYAYYEWVSGGDGQIFAANGTVSTLPLGSHTVGVTIFDGVSWGNAQQVAYDIQPDGDSTPDQFTFNDVINAEPSTEYSDQQPITGVDTGVTLNVTNGLLTNDDGSTWLSSVTYVAGQTYIRGTVTSSGLFDTETTSSPSVNGVSDTFSVTTRSADLLPDTILYAPVKNADLTTQYESNNGEVSGVDAGQDVPVTVSGGEYAVSTDGGTSFGAFTATPTNVQLGHIIKLRVTSSDTEGVATTCTLNVGGMITTFRVTTLGGSDAGKIVKRVVKTPITSSLTASKSLVNKI